MAVSGTMAINTTTLLGGSGAIAAQRGSDTWGANYVYNRNGLQNDILLIAESLDSDASGLLSVNAVNAATYTVTSTDIVVHVQYTPVGVCDITLPTSEAGIEGRKLEIKDASGNAGTNNIFLLTEGAETVDGSASGAIGNDYESVSLYAYGGNWYRY